jgi:lysozyme family protein
VDSRSQYSPAFLKAIAFILPHEEEFARNHWGDENFVVPENVSGDPGGVTKYGIDASSHPGVDIKDLTRDQAVEIYHQEWRWRNMDALPEKLAICCFDVFVNGGTPIHWLQAAINKVGNLPIALSKDLIPLTMDGDLGPKTLAAAQACDQAAVIRYFIYERDARFVSLASNNPSLAKFLAGWEQRDVDLQKYLLAASKADTSALA